MLKSFSAWNQEQFNEYMNIAHKYESNVNDDIFIKSSFSGKTNQNPSTTNNKRQVNDNFYSFPGVTLSDEANESDSADKLSSKPINKNQEFHKINKTSSVISNDKIKFGFNQNKSANMKHMDDKKVKPSKNSEYCADILCNDDLRDCYSEFVLPNQTEAYSQAANNLKSFIQSLKHSKYNTFSSFSNDFRKAILYDDCVFDKSVQTLANEKFNKKSLDKSNQTAKVKTKNTGIVTDDSLMHQWYQDYVTNRLSDVGMIYNTESAKQLNEKAFKSNNHSHVATTDSGTSGRERGRNMTSNKNDNTAPGMRKTSNFTVNKKPGIPKGSGRKVNKSADKLGTTKLIDETKSITESDCCSHGVRNDSINDDVTCVSKSNSKFASFNDILENFGLQLKNSENLIRKSSNNSNPPRQSLSKNLHSDQLKCPSLNSMGSSFWDNPLDKIESIFGKNKINLKDVELLSTQNGSVTEAESTNLASDTAGCCNTVCENIEKDSSISKRSQKLVIPKMFNHKSQSKSDYRINGAAGDVDKWKYSKTFILNPYDDVIKSHFSQFDRRIKSVSAKNNSLIVIDGPINPTDNQSANYHHNSASGSIVYNCTISSNNQENLDKCINYLRETFPNTYLKSGVKK